MTIIAVVGVGYVGLGLAIALSKTYKVFGFDTSEARIKELQQNWDKNRLIAEEELATSSIHFTHKLEEIKSANFFIITVSTPAHYYLLPDLTALENATKNIASLLKKGDIVVYESTCYPGATEEVCLPLLQEISQLEVGRDFNIGYSPERINPHDTIHTLENIPKIISAQNQETLETIATVYSNCSNQVYKVSNIKTAEAVKILENTQRDVNIAFMNEFAEIMHAMNLDMHEIIEAAKTKWNFGHYKPGLVGGHCIAVDPLYLAFKAKRLGVNSDLMTTARKINDNITLFIVRELNKILMNNNMNIKESNIGIFGITYKENSPDIRNSLALKLIKELKSSSYNCQIHDPFADKQVVKEKYLFELKEFAEINELSIAIVVVDHDYYRQIGIEKFLTKFTTQPIILDIPNLFVNSAHQFKELQYWHL